MEGGTATASPVGGSRRADADSLSGGAGQAWGQSPVGGHWGTLHWLPILVVREGRGINERL